ncbi:TPM domain-containing protein [Pseudomonas sp. GD04087]|uniref:TPM domain-containing protein n=1 Tax=unclassified Pseudomonas TaxID=196821 RepID=UPI00244C1A9B|nr:MULTISPECIES: TPM domain-containing protein [unclassified Pseudomonas]MDH0292504.1 TPM domain-containing protein [Pseudomonas sp. GD04087]MDH1051141.1 TPM domain-containing protein [Pseudomonas sp. GD03903]MDH1998475.1 TPM domain-containing protein [Pseudomonas sp. GD03691]
MFFGFSTGWCSALWLLLCLLCVQHVWAAPASDGGVLLPLGERVVDVTGTLDSSARERLIGKLKALEDRRGAQIAVVMLPTVGPMGIEAFSEKLFNLWKLGRKGVDDGVLLVVAKDDHRMRIEVGYGLEGVIPDVVAGRIIRERMAPAFRAGDYAGGIESAVDALIALVDGEALPEPAPEPLNIPLEAWLLLASFVAGGVGGVLLAARRIGWRGALALGAVGVALVALLASGTDRLATIAIAPLCLLIGGATFGALWTVRAVFYSVLGLIAYCVLLGLLTPRFGAILWLYALAAPVAVLAIIGLWWLLISMMRDAWRGERKARKGRKGRKANMAKPGRKGFYARLLILFGLYLLVGFFVGAPKAPLNWLLVLPFMCLPGLLVFAAGQGGSAGSSGSGGGSSGGSSGGGGFSGGGGSSGGGGASGSW